jgi:hypothetical protein
MKEELLWFIWQYKAFSQEMLKTTDGEAISIIKTGTRNTDAGPDFREAQLKIGETIWAGNVEMHLSASMWNEHKHQHDSAYDNVILHVVAHADAEVFSKSGRKIQTLDLSKYWNDALVNEALALQQNLKPVACAGSFHLVDDFKRTAWFERLAVERLEAKSKEIENKNIKNKMDWAQTFYEYIARYLGMRINSDPMEWLANKTPNLILAKVKPSLFKIEALLLGQSGMLQQAPDDDYVQQLKQEYDFQQKKHSLQPMQAHVWKHLRLRPANFPAVRIAQLAALINSSEHLFSTALEIPVEQLSSFFDVSASSYWDTHYKPGVPSTKKSTKKLGSTATDIILINAVAPVLFAYGKHTGNENYKSKAIELLAYVKAEKNRFTRLYEELGRKPFHAMESQAMIQLFTTYCHTRECLKCAIGTDIVLKQRK